MNNRTKAWQTKHMTKGVKIAQSRIVSQPGSGYMTQVSLTDENGQELNGWHNVDGTEASTQEEAQHQQANAFYDTEVPATTPPPEPIDPVTNPDGTINREQTFIEAQKHAHSMSEHTQEANHATVITPPESD